jgi:hypothetical protein
MNTLFRTLAIGLMLFVSMLPTATAQAEDNVFIPFADLGNNIRDWHAENSEVLFVQNATKDWFRITFWTPCLELPFATGIAFVTDGTSRLDRYSSVLVNGESCKFRTFERSASPQPDAGSDDESEQ